MKSILDKSFQYVPSARTNIAKTFRRIRAQLKAEAEAKQVNETEIVAKVRQLKRK